MADFKAMQDKWQKRWSDEGIFKVNEDKPNKYYLLEMYPYPSGSGLHMGHARNYTIGDVFARFKRMSGFNVLYPMGYDSFGLPAENAAIEAKSHPKKFTEDAIKNFIRQQKELGLSYDWDRMIASHDPAYYKWDQWIFLKMYEKGLAYKKNAAVNWCPQCNTVLANEQVHNGKCWRHPDTAVKIKDLNQWFFKITDYAQELLEKIDTLDGWAEDVKAMQRNWIGRSEGSLMDFRIEGSEKKLQIFTTRPDTLFGITFLVYAPEHPDVMELVQGTEHEGKVKEFVQRVVQQDRFHRTAAEKEGMFIGKHAAHPITGEKIPIYIANFVLYEYGTGAIIAVPAHDQRDFEFAKKYELPIRVVINPTDHELDPEKMARAYMGDGVLVNSGDFDGMNNREAISEITKFLEERGCGKRAVRYRLRDWLISRQRFWGCPIPIIYCDDCGIMPVPEAELPVKLPDDIEFEATGGNPLEQADQFVNTKCPKCGRGAKRETDTMDTFVDSSWYFLRYCDPHNDDEIFDKEKVKYWMPIDTYIGGKEHATMHLIYFRFFTKFLRDLGLLEFDEPAINMFNQGMLHKGGFVMSKSRGNVVTQEEISEKYGIDTARLFLVFVGGPDKDMEWDEKTVEGSYRFLNKVYRLITEKEMVDEELYESKRNKTIREVTAYISSFRYNLALINIMDFANYLNSKERISRSAAETLLLLLSPFTPHLAEELWEGLGNQGFISLAEWPSYDESKIDEKEDVLDDMISGIRSDIHHVKKLACISDAKKIMLIVSPNWKYDLFSRLKEEMEKTFNAGDIIKSLMETDLKKHGEDISKIVPAVVKDTSKIPSMVLDQETELAKLRDSAQLLAEEFKCQVEVVAAEDSTESKARNAAPGKPAIVIA